MKVFLSSTYVDLIEHRKAAHDALEQLGLHVIWMEALGARAEDSTTACLNEVEESDLIVGIYAYRYGYIPKDISLTEQEFDHAQKLGKPILGFIVNEDHDWKIKYVEHDKKDKLNAFLNKVKKQPVEFFTTPDNLARKIASSVGRYITDQKLKEQNKIQVSIAGDVNGNIVIGDKNTTSSSQVPIYQSPKPINSTLPNQPYFIGREEEIKKILDAISPESRTWGVFIFGEGGIGKTALAIEAAHRTPPTIFENKIFVSAKERELTSKGEFSSKEFSQNSYYAILNEIALQMGGEGIPLLAPSDRANAVKLALNTKKVLLILDNLETLDNDDRDHLYQFLTRLPQGCKAIVTSRRRDETEGRIIRLDRLELTEGEKLISELVKRNPRLHTIEESEKDELFYAANGNPLIIRWLIGQVGRDGTNIKTITEAIRFMRQAPKEEYGKNKNDPIAYVFGDLLSSLIPREKFILAVMVFLSLSPKIEWIAKITGYDEKNIEIILDELVNRSILSTIEETKGYFLPPLPRQLILRKLSDEVADAEEKLAHYAFRVIIEYGGRKNTQNQEKLAENWALVFAAIPFYIKTDNQKLQFICDTLDMFLGSRGLLDELLWLNQQAELVALGNTDYETAGIRAYKVGLIYGYRGQSADVLQYAKRAENDWKDAYLTRETYNSVKPFVKYLQGVGYKIEKKYQKAIDATEEAIDIWKTLAPVSIEIADSLNTLGEIHIEMAEIRDQEEHLSNAENSISEALRIANKINYKEGRSKYKGNLAYLALTNNDWTKAIILAQEALVHAKEIGYQVEIARENFILASAYFELGHVEGKGIVAIRESVEIYTRLRHKDLPLAEKLKEKWEKKMGIRI